LNGAGLGWAPGCSMVGGGALADAVLGAGEHPQAAVFAFDDHVFIKVGAWKSDTATAGPGLALIG